MAEHIDGWKIQMEGFKVRFIPECRSPKDGKGIIACESDAVAEYRRLEAVNGDPKDHPPTVKWERREEDEVETEAQEAPQKPRKTSTTNPQKGS